MPEPIATLIDLTDRVVVVTGGGAGMGRATCHRLAEAGAQVVVADVDATRAEEAAAELRAAGGRAEGTSLDVVDVDAIAALAADVAGRYGRLDAWVNNAGIYPPAPLFDTSVDEFDRMIDINLRGVYFGTREAARHMVPQGRGVVVNISSIAAYRAGNPNLAHYAGSKAGVLGLTATLAGAFGPYGVRVCGIAPGVIVTEGLQAGMDAMDRMGGNLSNRAEMVPLRRVGDGDDIARAVLFLVSDLAAFVTGVTIPVDGGDLVNGAAANPPLSELGLAVP